MHTYRVNIFHITYGNTVSGAVTHYLILDFFPSGDAAFYQDFTNTGKTETIFQNFHQFCFIVSDTAATSTQSISRPENNRVSNSIGKGYTIFYRFYYQRSSNRLTDFLHGIFKFLTVFRLFDCHGSGSDQTYIMLFQETSLFQLHSQIQTCLASQCRKNAVWFFFHNKLLHHFDSQWFNINFICDILIRHDGCRIGVEQYNFNSFFFQRTAGLCSCVVKLSGLTDNNRT